MSITEKLDQLSELWAARDAAQLEKEALIESVFTPEIRAALAEIDMEFHERLELVNEKAAALEAEIKREVIQNGASVKGRYLQAVYSKPRVSWDAKLLEGLMIAIPQIEKARKVGEPSASLRKI
jgi:hypothetical protein